MSTWWFGFFDLEVRAGLSSFGFAAESCLLDRLLRSESLMSIVEDSEFRLGRRVSLFFSGLPANMSRSWSFDAAPTSVK